MCVCVCVCAWVCVRVFVSFDFPLLHADNVFGVKTWCNKRFGMEEKAINKQFDIPEDLDYV